MITKDSNAPGTSAQSANGVIRIIIADADTGFMTSIQDYLQAQPGYEVVARVESCMDTLVWCEELKPQILILDWHLMFEGLLPAEQKGVTFLQKIKALKNPPAVIVASRLSLDDHRAAALAAGADEFMPKTKFPQLIRPLIKQLVAKS
ncbi:MAG: response regulator [Verrucomicrobiota bacterium]